MAIFAPFLPLDRLTRLIMQLSNISRINCKLSLTFSDITEVQFAPNAQTSPTTDTSGLTVTEYVVIGISSLLLGLIYVASVFLYLHIRKRRKAASEESKARKLKSINKDGKILTERDIVRINNERMQTLPVLGQDDGVIKKNPLLSRQYHDSKSGFPSDSGSNVSDSDDFAGSSSRSEDNVCKVSKI